MEFIVRQQTRHGRQDDVKLTVKNLIEGAGVLSKIRYSKGEDDIAENFIIIIIIIKSCTPPNQVWWKESQPARSARHSINNYYCYPHLLRLTPVAPDIMLRPAAYLRQITSPGHSSGFLTFLVI